MQLRCLRTALDKTTGITHKDSRFNPKAIRAQEMYGEVDPATGEWNTGVTLCCGDSAVCFYAEFFGIVYVARNRNATRIRPPVP